MLDWAREKVGAEGAGSATLPGVQSEAARSSIDFPRDKREFDEFPLHEALGLTLVELREGVSRVCLTTNRVTLGGVGGSVHGGILAAMVDIAMLEALVPLLRAGETTAGTVDLSITYLRPALGAQIFAEATVLRKGRTTVVTEISISDSEGRLCAKGRTIYALRQATG
ncbi:MAG: PaaI family thioesterase [Tepidiformaceae bacterium]